MILSLRSSQQYAVPMAPVDQGIDAPHSRPVEALTAGVEGFPEALDGTGVQADSGDAIFVEEHLFHRRACPFANPGVEREHEAGFGAHENGRVESREADLAKQ